MAQFWKSSYYLDARTEKMQLYGFKRRYSLRKFHSEESTLILHKGASIFTDIEVEFISARVPGIVRFVRTQAGSQTPLTILALSSFSVGLSVIVFNCFNLWSRFALICQENVFFFTEVVFKKRNNLSILLKINQSFAEDPV